MTIKLRCCQKQDDFILTFNYKVILLLAAPNNTVTKQYNVMKIFTSIYYRSNKYVSTGFTKKMNDEFNHENK